MNGDDDNITSTTTTTEIVFYMSVPFKGAFKENFVTLKTRKKFLGFHPNKNTRRTYITPPLSPVLVSSSGKKSIESEKRNKKKKKTEKKVLFNDHGQISIHE